MYLVRDGQPLAAAAAAAPRVFFTHAELRISVKDSKERRESLRVGQYTTSTGGLFRGTAVVRTLQGESQRSLARLHACCS